MKIIKQSWQFEEEINGEEILRKIEKAGRTCYKTEGKISDFESTKVFVKRCIDRGHLSVIEHHNITVRIITDRGVTHEIVRHRLASYSQESTRYCNYRDDKFGKEITVILPVWFYHIHEDTREALFNFGTSFDESNSSPRERQYSTWVRGCYDIELRYFNLLELGQTPQEARSVLPNSLKTEIVMTANIREWQHFFTLRCSNDAHPQMRDLARDMLEGFKSKIPVLFDNIAWS